MTDIKMPPMPKPHTPPVFATAANTPSVKAGHELGGYEKTPPLFDEHQLEAFAREAVRLNAQAVPDEPDWRHPKIQGLIGSEARLRIAIDLIWQILEDPNQEFTASDMEYWDTIHDDLKAALSAAPAAPQPAQPLTDEQIYGLYRRAGLATYHPRDDVVQRTYDKCINDFARAIEQAHGIGVKND